MSTNQALAEAFGEIAGFLDLMGEDRFRAIAHEKAARIIESYPGDVRPIATGPDAKARLTEIEGIGARLADKIIEFCTTGKLRELDELRAKAPTGLIPLMRIGGLGPKTLHTLWKSGGVTDLTSLKALIDSGKILELPRMGEKSAAKLRDAITLAEEGSVRLPLGVALPMAEALVLRLGAVAGVKRVAYAGSLRRGRESVGYIDILVSTSDPAAVSDAFRTGAGVRQILAQGDARSSVRMAVGRDGGRWGTLDESLAGPSIQVDLKIIPDESWGAALHYFTGSKDHNIAMRQRALDRGLTLNEYGLFPNDAEATPPQQRGVRPVSSATEEDIFKALGLPMLPPEVRENRGEMRLAETPRLIEVGDIRAELHSHTSASDGRMSIAELAAEAQRRGFHTVAVTDHSRSSAIAGGLSVERLRAHIQEVQAVDERMEGIRVLAGSEVDILVDGRLDYDDELLAQLGMVVASPHASLSQEPALATTRLLRAIENPHVRVLGHPTGRLINRRAGLSVNMGEVIAAAKEHGVALEINAHWMRLDLRDVHVHAAVEAGCLIAIDCDVHSAEDFDLLRYGVMTGKRGWLRPEQCVNTWTAERLEEWAWKGRGRG